MSWVITGVAVGGLGVLSGMKTASDTMQQGELKNKLEQINAKYADIDAAETKVYGFTQAARYQRVIDQTTSQQRAGYAAQNVDSSSGTAAEVIADSKVTGMLNQIDMEKQAREKALGFTQQAMNIRTGASVGLSQAEINADAEGTKGVLGGIQTGISLTGYGYGRNNHPENSYTGPDANVNGGIA